MKSSIWNMALSGLMASALLLSATSAEAATLPSAPTNVTATAGDGSATEFKENSKGPPVVKVKFANSL